MRRIGSGAIGLAMLLASCSAGVPTTGQETTTTTTAIVPVSLVTPPVETTTSTVATTTTTNDAPSTTVADTPTTSAVTPTTTSPSADITVAPYFYIDESGHDNRSGPFLVPVTRRAPWTKGVARAAVEQLLAGPTTGELDGIPSITTTVPTGARLLGLTVSEGIAIVDLSGEFDATDDDAAVAQRIAQVVFTLSRFPTIHEVLFRQDGIDIEVPTGDGQLVSRPVAIGDYLELAAAIHVEEPAYAGKGSNPLHVTGFGAVFEATFSYALTDDDGLIISEGFAMTNNGTGWGGFDFTIEYEVDREQVGALIVWVNSAKDGSQIDVREYPVVLVP